MQATPGQTGLAVRIAQESYWYWIWWYGPGCTQNLPLTETAAGVYRAQWSAVQDPCNSGPYLMPDGTYTVFVVDAAGNQSATTGQIVVQGVSQVSAAPSQFNAAGGETATLSAIGTAGLSLEARLYQNNSLVRSLPMNASGGNYTATWDGRNSSGALAPVGSYEVQVWHTGSPGRYNPTTQVQVSAGLSSVTGSPNPFTPTGANAATITVQATPGQTGLAVRIAQESYWYWIWWYGPGCTQNLPLTETAAGVYRAQWSAVQDPCNSGPYLMPDGTYTVFVVDAAGNQSATTGQIVVQGVSQVSAAPSQFNAAGGETATLSAIGTAGLSLEARLYQNNSLVRSLPMNASGGNYTATWDGRNSSGALAPVGSYEVQVWHTGSPGRYNPTTQVQVSAGVSSVTGSPNPFTPTGANTATITVQAAPGQTGLAVRIAQESYWYWIWWYGPGCTQNLPLTETAAGVYRAQWSAVQDPCNSGPYLMPDGTYTVFVVDAAGNQSATTGQIVVQGVSQVSSSPNPFTPGGNNVATLTANAAPGLNLEAKVFNTTTNVLTRVLPLTEASGTYTAEWDGKDGFGNFAGANTYRLEIYPVGAAARYYPTSSVVVKVAVFSISASPDPFVPAGNNATTIAVRADPLQSGMKATVTHPNSGTSSYLPLTETGSEGTYTTTWDGTINGAIPRDGVMTIRVYDVSGNQFPATGTLTLSSVKSLSMTPNPFEITGSNNATISAEMPAGLALQARIGSVRTLALAETAGRYTASWDGRNDVGHLVQAGTYSLTLWNATTNARYDLQTNVNVTIRDTEAPETLMTVGPAEGSAIAETTASFAWSGSDNLDAGALNFAYHLDDQPWSAFSTATGVTLTGLVEGAHRVQVKARDAAGNEDATPAERHFTVDTTPPAPASAFTARIVDAGIRLDWGHSPSPDVALYRLYWNRGSGAIDYGQPLATIVYPTNAYVVSGLTTEGTYRFGLRAADKAGNLELNTDVTAQVDLVGLSVSVAVEHDTYDRGQDVPVTGLVRSPTGDPAPNVAVAIAVRSNAATRTFTAYTNAQGEFHYSFQPLASEAGSYRVEATVQSNGLTQSASDSFRILGLWLQPATLTLDLSMNAGRTVDLTLGNIGDVALTGLQYAVEDLDTADPLSAIIDAGVLPARLEPGAQLSVPVQLESAAGAAPATPAAVRLRAESAEGSVETAVVNVRLADAVARPVIVPQPLKVGVRPGESTTRTLTVTNAGYAPIASARLALQQPAAYPWIQVLSGDLGGLAPQQTKEVQVQISPPAGMPLGTHVVQLDLSYDGKRQSAYATVEIAASDVGALAIKVYDDTGSVVNGAEVSFISKAFSVNTTPDGGRQEYNNVIQGRTNAAGALPLADVPAGDYRYLIQAPGHDPLEGQIRVEPGTDPQPLSAILVTNLVKVDFKVTPTTIQDQYDVTLQITYATNLTKPTLYASPSQVGLSFFPEETQTGVVTITNTSNSAAVRELRLSSADLDPTDNELELVFSADGSKVVQLPDLGPKESVQVPYTARIVGAAPKLNSRHAGNLVASGHYTYSIDGQALEGTTVTPIPVIYSRPQDLRLPTIAYVNDERDGDLCDLEYQGTTYRLNVSSNRNVSFDFDNGLKAVSHIQGGPDTASILAQNAAFWNGTFNAPPPLATKGDAVSFDIDGLKESMEARMCADRAAFFGHARSIGFMGRWSDRSDADTYLIPVSITTYDDTRIVVDQCVTCGGPTWTQPSIPTLKVPEGEVNIEIKQKIGLEREAFDVAMAITPSVDQLDNVHVTLHVADADGADASPLFYEILTQQSGLANLAGGTVTGPVNLGWQLVPSSDAGGDQPQGRTYSVSATLSFERQGNSYSYDTPTVTINVLPMPKLTVDYSAPYVVMAGKPAKIRVSVTNKGAGPANGLTIASAQPQIVDNPNGVPVSFAIAGSSPTAEPSGFQPGEMKIAFPTLPPGGTAEGYWELDTTKHGYFVPDRKLRFYRDVYSPAPGNPGGFNSFLDNRRRVTGMNEIRSHSWRLIGALILGRAEPSPCGCG